MRLGIFVLLTAVSLPIAANAAPFYCNEVTSSSQEGVDPKIIDVKIEIDIVEKDDKLFIDKRRVNKLIITEDVYIDYTAITLEDGSILIGGTMTTFVICQIVEFPDTEEERE